MSVEAPVKLRDVYQDITDVVIAQLEKGVVPWRKPWVQGSEDSFLPKNVISNKSYRGWNVFWLNLCTTVNGYSSNRYITYKQAVECKGLVRKGQKGTQITYWLQLQRKPEEEGGEPGKRFMVPKIYTVFNIDQCDGLDFPLLEVLERTEHERIAIAEGIVDNMPLKPVVLFSGSQPCYIPSRDIVMMPCLSDFDNAEVYYSTMFHELAHSTGAAHRLNRKEIVDNAHSKTGYAYEELVAELTASFLNAITGSQPATLDLNSAYLASWLKHLKDDKKLILTAAARAQKAADFILDHKEEEVKPSMLPAIIPIKEVGDAELVIIPEIIIINPGIAEPFEMIPPSKITGENCFNIKEKLLKNVARKFKATKLLSILEYVQIKNNSAIFTDLYHSVVIRNFGIGTRYEFVINKHDLFTGLQCCPTPLIKVIEGKVTFEQEDEHVSFDLATDSFPKIPDQEEYKEEGYTTEVFLEQINTAYKFLSKDELRPAMLCVNVSDQVMGTDAHRAYFEKNDALFFNDMLFTKKTIELLRMDNTGYKIESSKDYLRFTSKNLIIYQNIIDERYPNLMGIIPTCNSIYVELHVQTLIAKLKVAVKMANRQTHHVTLKFSPKGLIIGVSDEDMCKSNIFMMPTREYNRDDEFVLGFNGNFLLEILNNCNEWVAVKMEKPTNAVLFDDRMILMPIMLKES